MNIIALLIGCQKCVGCCNGKNAKNIEVHVKRINAHLRGFDQTLDSDRDLLAIAVPDEWKKLITDEYLAYFPEWMQEILHLGSWK